MSRDWFAVYLPLIGLPKYRRLTVPARAGLFHVWCLAGRQDPEATWRSLDALDDVLELDGFPPGVTAELLERGWLDISESGRVFVHDWDDHQLAATLAARTAYERDRKRDWRRRRGAVEPGAPAPDGAPVADVTPEPSPLSPAPLSPDITGTQQDITGQESPNVPARPRMSGTDPIEIASFNREAYDAEVAAKQEARLLGTKSA